MSFNDHPPPRDGIETGRINRSNPRLIKIIITIAAIIATGADRNRDLLHLNCRL